MGHIYGHAHKHTRVRAPKLIRRSVRDAGVGVDGEERVKETRGEGTERKYLRSNDGARERGRESGRSDTFSRWGEGRRVTVCTNGLV